MSEQEEKAKEVNEQGNVDNKEEEKEESLPHPNEINNEQPKEDGVKNEDKEGILRGIRCRWFTKDGCLQEDVFNTKDLELIN